MSGGIEFLWLVLAGAATGVFGAMLGTGGGVFLIPVLVIGLGVPIHNAVATGLIAVIATSSAVASVNVERGTVNMPLGVTLETATVLGAILGAVTAARLSARTLEALFAAVLVPTAVLMWRGRSSELPAPPAEPAPSPETVGGGRAAASLDGSYFDEVEDRLVVYRVRHLWAGLAVSVVAGNVSGLLGIGGGIFKVPALHLVCRMPIKAAAATSNFMIGVTAAASAFLYYGRGDVLPGLTAATVLGVLAGSALGSGLNRRVRGILIRRLFAVLLIAVAFEMFSRAAGG